ncbi:cation:proton antiporter [Candidatus Micrarchaeota archaeon]|nr:MAG: cation:proton antiporter [Candidatus Micrarchaeota archaeon]
MLLLRIGLHSQITQIFNLRNFVVALLGIAIPFVAGYYFALFFGGGETYALFMGAALTATSVGVTVAVLKEFGVMGEEFSKTILGAAVIDDILALLVLSFIVNAPETLDAASLEPLLRIAGTALVFIVGGILIGREAIKHAFAKIGKANENRAFLLAMAFAFFYAYLAEYVGLSGIVGVFIAGVSLNYSKAVKGLYDMMTPLEMLFTPIFFISLGMLIDVGSLASIAVPVILLSVVAVISKVVGSGGGALFFGMNRREALAVGMGMVPRGEIALIIALFGITATTASGEPALTAVEYTTISAMAFLTTLAAPPVLARIIGGVESGQV